MSNLFDYQKDSYPGEIIRQSRAAYNGAVRLSPERPKRMMLRGAAEEKRTLRETENPKLGVMYDDFEIDSFVIDGVSGKAKVAASISLTNVHESMSIFAKLVNQDTQTVLADLPFRTVSDSCRMQYKEEALLPTDAIREDITLIVYGAWGNKTVDEVELALVEDYNEGAPQIFYEHEYPKKEQSYITFPRGKKTSDISVDASLLYDKGRNTRDEEHIMVALYRTPDDGKDLDYLCLFGTDRVKNKPWLGVPGKGTLHAVSGTKFLYGGENEPVAKCIIRPIGGDSGGSMVVACTGNYEAKEGSIVLTKYEDSLEYDMTGPWGVTYDQMGRLHLGNFHYEFQIAYTIQLPSGMTKRHTSYISSDSGRGVCLERIKPVCLRYGCFGEGTKVLMADGLEKKIEEIRIGDLVCTEGGEKTAVRNIWTGTEKTLTFTLSGGRQITVTANHPLLTSYGWMWAGDIREGMSLAGAWDKDVSYSVLAVEENEEEKIYNLETEKDDGAAICANGIIAGDFLMQNSPLHAKEGMVS